MKKETEIYIYIYIYIVFTPGQFGVEGGEKVRNFFKSCFRKISEMCVLFPTMH